MKVRSKYSSSILKFKLSHKLQNNKSLASLGLPQPGLLRLKTGHKLPDAAPIEHQKDLRHTRTFHEPDKLPRLNKQATAFKKGVIEDVAVSERSEHLESYIIEDSEGSIGSLISEEQETDDLYSTSLMAITSTQQPEELVDKDLLDLLAFIKHLPSALESEIASKAVSFGEVTRHKTLIFDMDETLI